MNKLLPEDAKYVVGVDEVGRGPLAGPVVAAAVILDKDRPVIGLRDSKKLSEKKRRVLAYEIKENSISYAFGRADVEEIDDINILQASLLAMQRAVRALHKEPDHALVDGNHSPKLLCPVIAVVKGDDSVDCIAAASIIAKVERDQEMLRIHDDCPQYGFDLNKGYPTKYHIESLIRYGASDHHRRSFSPVRKVIQEKLYKADTED